MIGERIHIVAMKSKLNKPLYANNLQAARFAMSPRLHFTAKRSAYKLRLTAALSRWEKLSVSSRVKVPVGKGLTSHPYRVLILLRSRVTDERNYKVSVHRVTCRP